MGERGGEKKDLQKKRKRDEEDNVVAPQKKAAKKEEKQTDKKFEKKVNDKKESESTVRDEIKKGTDKKKAKKLPPPPPSSNWAVIAKRIGVDPHKSVVSQHTQPPPTLDPLPSKEQQHMHAIQAKAKQWLASPDPIPGADPSLTKYLALDCEMVGVGEDGKESILAEVAIVNVHGACVYHSYVKPTEFVTNWRTRVSGITPKDALEQGREFSDVQREVSEIIKGKEKRSRFYISHTNLSCASILPLLQAGSFSVTISLMTLKFVFPLSFFLPPLLLTSPHSQALHLSHPFKMTRDTAKYRPLTRSKAKPRSLKWLAKNILSYSFQEGILSFLCIRSSLAICFLILSSFLFEGAHSPILDARASALLYLAMKKEWEGGIAERERRQKTRKSQKEKQKERHKEKRNGEEEEEEGEGEDRKGESEE